MVVKWGGKVSDHWETVRLGEAGEFQILVKRPTFRERGELLALHQSNDPGWIDAQFRTVFVDWRDLSDSEGSPVPFSFEALVALDQEFCIYQQLLEISGKYMTGKGEAELKNSAASLTAASGTATPKKSATDSTNTSDSPASEG